MINLIPKEEKKRMALCFYFRLAILFLALINVSLFFTLVAFLPAYFSSSSKDAVFNAKLETQKAEPLPVLGEQSLFMIKDINNKLYLVENAEKNKFLLSVKIINEILLKKRSDIKVTQILYDDDGKQNRKISLTGLAPSREVLLLFRQTLEDNPVFKNVDLPNSNFIKGYNIQFSLTLKPV